MEKLEKGPKEVFSPDIQKVGKSFLEHTVAIPLGNKQKKNEKKTIVLYNNNKNPILSKDLAIIRFRLEVISSFQGKLQLNLIKKKKKKTMAKKLLLLFLSSIY